MIRTALKKYWRLVALFTFILIGGIFLVSRTSSPILPPSHSPTPSGVGKSIGIIRITIREPGMYILTPQDLTRLGLESVNPTQLRLFNLGQPQPLWFSGDVNLQLYFYGQPLNTPYTRENVYFLTTSANKLPNYPLSIIHYQLPITLSLPLHLEENTLYLPKAEPDHTWYWQSLTAPTTASFDLTISHLAEGETTLHVALFSTTEAGNTSPDHHLRLLLNNTLISDQTWDGRGSQTLEATLTAGTLREGTNTLTIELPGDTGVVVETVVLDWIEIEYPRQLVVEEDRLPFTGTGAVLELAGFRAPPMVFDLSLTGDGSPAEVHASDMPTPTEPDHLYFAVAPDGFLRPDAMSPAQLSPDLRTARATYIAIGPPDLLEPLQPLLAHREAQGITTLAVPVEAVYDQFGGGLSHPEAIRSFLQFAYQNWETPLHYLLLVGDSTYDPRGYQAPPEANRVPSFFRFTFFGGETVSDILFAQLDDDGLPDLAVGRIPARTPKQVAIVVEKTLAYEQSPPTGEWAHRILAIADGQEASFQMDAETFLGYFPTEYTPILLTPPKGDAAAPGQISDALDEGVLFMSYFGHGSITLLGKDRIFSVEDAAALTNGAALPIMINITCLAGLFTHPDVESLTEAMLWNPKGGAVAALSATSLTVPADQAFLSKALVDALIQNPEATLGELLLIAQRQLPVDHEGVREVMETFLLFGDPALNLP